MGAYHAVLEPDAEDFLADISNGDARAALTAIELGVLTTERSEDGKIHITLDVAQECIQKRAVRYDKMEIDTMIRSAFIQKYRGSDPDAIVYYLARMLYAGEDIRFYCKENDDQCIRGCGKCRPECIECGSFCSISGRADRDAGGRIVLAQAATYLASAQK